MNIKFTENIPEPEQIFNLFITTGWNETYNLTVKELFQAVKNSWFSISAYHEAKLVGFARVLADGVVHAMIYDMIVLPEYQNKGIGSKILNLILEHCVQNRIRDIQLFSADGKMAFYEKHGFKKRPPHALGLEIRNIYHKRSLKSMFKVNEYFEGKVKSLAFQDKESDATLGIMAPGEYEFGTSQREYMTVITGKMKVLLPATEDWKIFEAGATFIVEPNQKFQLEITENSTYLCRYKEIKGNCGCADCNC